MTKTQTEIAAVKWLKNPFVIETCVKIAENKTQMALLEALLNLTFMEGAKYATQRCADAGHGT